MLLISSVRPWSERRASPTRPRPRSMWTWLRYRPRGDAPPEARGRGRREDGVGGLRRDL